MRRRATARGPSRGRPGLVPDEPEVLDPAHGEDATRIRHLEERERLLQADEALLHAEPVRLEQLRQVLPREAAEVPVVRILDVDALPNDAREVLHQRVCRDIVDDGEYAGELGVVEVVVLLLYLLNLDSCEVLLLY